MTVTKTGLHPQEQQAAETTSGCLAGQFLQVCDFKMWDNEISTAGEIKKKKKTTYMGECISAWVLPADPSDGLCDQWSSADSVLIISRHPHTMMLG